MTLLAKPPSGLGAQEPGFAVTGGLYVPEGIAPLTTDPQTPHILTLEELGLARDRFWKGEPLTTGDHISDCLAIWYGPDLNDEIIDTFRELDTKVRANIGQLAMVVVRREGQGQQGTTVDVQYQIGRLIGDVGLYMELEAAQVKLPTDGSYRVASLPSGKPGLTDLPTDHPMIVHRMFDLASTHHTPALSFNSINLLSHTTTPAIIPNRIGPTTSVHPHHVLELLKPCLGIVIGDTRVREFLETDTALELHGEAMGTPIADFLLRHFDLA